LDWLEVKAKLKGTVEELYLIGLGIIIAVGLAGIVEVLTWWWLKRLTRRLKK